MAGWPAGFGWFEAAGAGSLALSAAVLVLFLTLPLLALVGRALGGGGLAAGMRQPLVAHALALTLLTTSITVGLSVVLGLPLAFGLARVRFPGRGLVETVVTLPLALPPLVAGVGLLVAFGRRGVLGGLLAGLGVDLPFSTAAVILAQLFVAGPFFIRAARVGFRNISREMEEAAAIAGASGWQTFRRVTLPLAAPALASGVVLCAARAFSEFGATLMFAGNIEGRTQTMALAIETAIQTDLNAALSLSLVLMVIAGLALAIPLLLLRSTDAGG